MDSKDTRVPQSELAIAEANNHLAVQLYQLLATEQKNVFFSPFSISTAMAMLFCGCKGETADEMKPALGYNSAKIEDSAVKSCFESLLKSMEGDKEGYTLASANSIMIEKTFPVKEEFLSTVENSFRALIREVNFFTEGAKSLKELNEWVKSKTNNMISELLTSFPPLTVMILLNAVYFKGFWLKQFKKRDTKQKVFYNNGIEKSGKKVQMMHMTHTFPFTQETSFKALQLPYKGKEISMLILLPNTINGLNELENSLTPALIHLLQERMRERKVNVAFPKFRFEYAKSLIDQFKALGVNKIFIPGADFGGINDSKALYIAEIAHKAVIEVNEEGAEAAAATAVVMALRSAPSKPIVKNFIADHPFLFLIYNCKNNLIYFMGKVNEL